jgi:hypothetical protein
MNAAHQRKRSLFHLNFIGHIFSLFLDKKMYRLSLNGCFRPVAGRFQFVGRLRRRLNEISSHTIPTRNSKPEPISSP